MSALQLLLALLVATSLPTRVQAADTPKRPSALAIQHLDESTSALRWSGSAGTFRAQAVKLNRRGNPRPTTSRICTAVLSQAGPGQCSVARLSPGRWRIRVTHVTGGSAAIRTKTLVIPIMQGLPTSYATCAGEATSVKEAAYNCLRDWKPKMEKYPGKVVYHFSPSITASEKASIKEVTEFVLTRADPYIELAGYAPEFHVFYNMDSPKSCRRLYQSWAGTKNKSWLWERSGYQCSQGGWGGNGVGSDIPQTTSAGVSIPRSDPKSDQRFGPSGEWSNFEFYTYWVLAAEERYGFHGTASEVRYKNQIAYLDAFPYWVGYISGTAMGNASGIQLLNASLEQYHQVFVGSLSGRQATWQPTVTDRRFGPGAQIDLPGLEAEVPWRYDIQFLATQYVTAMFGPEWVDRVLIPSLMREEGPLNDYDAFQQKADRVAKMIWGGTWGEFEAAIDEYVISELKALGVKGLK